MAKITVIKEPGGDRTPFLRGILVQSLVSSGLGFAEAYALAQDIRAGLQDIEEITSSTLQEKVAALLGERHGAEARRLYEAKQDRVPGIIVHTPTRSAPFSAGMLAHSLEACSIAPALALQASRRVYTALKKAGHREIDHKALRRVIYHSLKEHCPGDSAERYLSWRRFENSGAALILLIGGATGTGKSTLSHELAYRLNISRTQSTDMMREIIRSYLSTQVLPTLGYSSFEAWRGLPAAAEDDSLEIEEPVITGFLSQFAAMKPAIEATIEGAIRERQHLILEGVHVLPTELDLASSAQAVIVPFMLVTMERQQLGRQLRRRGREASEHEPSRYLEALDDIWALQSHLLSEADRAGIDIIRNWSIEDTVHAALDLVVARIMEHYPPRAGEEVWEE